jgi:hypothetical protein
MPAEGVLAPKWPWRARAGAARGENPEPEREEPRELQGSPELASPGLEPGTPRFPVGALRLSNCYESPAKREDPGADGRVEFPGVCGI